MTEAEIGEYSRCTHGPDGGRRFGCIPCALNWHTQQQVYYAELAELHLTKLRSLEDEQIARNMASAGRAVG